MHGLNGPESKTACMFRRVRQVAAPGGGICRLRLHLVYDIDHTGHEAGS